MKISGIPIRNTNKKCNLNNLYVVGFSVFFKFLFSTLKIGFFLMRIMCYYNLKKRINLPQKERVLYLSDF